MHRPTPRVARTLLPLAALLACVTACERAAPAPMRAPLAPAPREPEPTPEFVEMGERTIGPWVLTARRDYTELYPGVEIPTDVRISAAPGAPEIVAVRLWFGYENPLISGSVVVEATRPDEQEPGHWRAVVAVPISYPEGPDIWVTIETAEGVAHTTWFRLFG